MLLIWNKILGFRYSVSYRYQLSVFIRCPVKRPLNLYYFMDSFRIKSIVVFPIPFWYKCHNVCHFLRNNEIKDCSVPNEQSFISHGGVQIKSTHSYRILLGVIIPTALYMTKCCDNPSDTVLFYVEPYRLIERKATYIWWYVALDMILSFS